MKYDVFISYSSLDQKVAEGVCAYLEQHRIRCFIAYRDIPKGVVWAKYIVEALDESRMMVVVFSGNLNCSEQVDREIELASEDHKPILTFRISAEDFKGAKKYYLKNLNWIDAFPQPEKCFGALCENVKLLLGNKQQEVTENSIRDTGENPADAKAQFDLGLCYYNRKDSSKAVYWYKKAAEQGYAPAQYNLGVCYGNGIGVEKDPIQAVYWYKKAAEQGHNQAQCNLGVYYDCNIGEKRDMAQAVYWYKKAAEQGYAPAQYNLGACYEFGTGVEKNKEQAVYWYKQAAKQGIGSAKDSLKRLRETW